jgi:hypothetical protein
MEWRTIARFPEHEVSEAGDVRRTVGAKRYPAGFVVKPKPHKRGYLVYSLNNRDILAHRLVALAFLGAPPSDRHEVAQEDGSRTNNHWRNLSWKLPVDNQADRKRHGTYTVGEACPSAKLTNVEAEEIRTRYANGGKPYVGGSVTMQALADEDGVSIAQVSRIVNGRERAAL